ncbi:MAG: phosphotransferase family protein [Acidimicrobiales bacterium]
MSEGLAAALTAVLRDATGDGAAVVTEPTRLSGGASRETWAFDLARGDGTTEALILRRDPPGGARTGPGGMAMEARLLTAAGQAGVPVPRLVVASEDPAPLGAGFVIMERIDGETIPRRILRDAAYAEARPRLAAQCGEILARLHRIDPDAAGPLEDVDQVAQYRDVLDALGQPHPAFELGLRWLESNRPPTRPRVVVHGDFRNGNLIVGPEGVRAVLDWELAHLGDPLEDLGWLCVKAWRFGVDHPVGGFGDYDDLLGAYVAAGGDPVDPDALRWWEAVGTLKWGIMCIMQANAHTSGLVRSVELAAIGRRVCENEWDLLALLPSPWNGAQ